MNNYFNPKWNISTVNSKIEELRYALELSIEQSKVIDEDSVNSVLHQLDQIQTTLKPFDGDKLFGGMDAAFPSEYANFVHAATMLGELFLTDPTLSVDQMKLEICAETDVIALSPYIRAFAHKTHLEEKEG